MNFPRPKFANIFLLAAFFIGAQCISPFIAQAFAGGDGSPGNPYQIATCADLQNIGSSSSSSFLVTGDIDCSGFGNFSPIASFTGALDGGNYTITGITIVNNGGADVGLFGYVSGATIQNLVLKDFSLTASNGAYIGAIAGHFDDGTLHHVNFINLTVDAPGSDYVGGIVGIATNINMSEVGITGTSSVVADIYVGGMIGILSSDDINNYSQVQNCFSTATVTAGDYVGGFIGNVDGTHDSSTVGFIKNSYETGNVYRNVPGNSFLGAFLGTDSFDTPVLNNFATGTVTNNFYQAFVDAGWFKDYSTNYYTGVCAGDCNGSGGVLPSSWYNTTSVAPLDQWDFSTVWIQQAGALPILRFGPIVSEVTPVTTPTNDSTPSYTFSSTKAGTITYGGSCSSAATSASSGSNTITFHSLVDGAYSDCTIVVTDSGSNVSNIFGITSFAVDTTGPSAPANFAASTSGATSNLSWTNPADGDFSSVTIRRSNTAYPTTPTADTLVLQNNTGTTHADNGLSDGTYYYSIFAKDNLGNFSIAANAVGIVDTVAPSGEFLSPSVASGGTTSLTSLPFALTFTEDMNGLTADDITVINGTLNTFSVAIINTQFSFNIVPSSAGTVTVNIASGKAQDNAGNDNTAAPQYGFTHAPISSGGGGGGFIWLTSAINSSSPKSTLKSTTTPTNKETKNSTPEAQQPVSSSRPLPDEPFTDVHSHWSRDFVLQLYNLKVIQGREPGKFAPEGNLTRAEAVKIGLLLNGYQLDVQTPSGFRDLDPEGWYVPYLRKAKKEGFIAGTQFRPNESITRVDALVMFLKMAKKQGEAPRAPFKDISPKSSYSQYINYAYAKGLIQGRSADTFEPLGTITRGEIAKIAMKMRGL